MWRDVKTDCCDEYVDELPDEQQRHHQKEKLQPADVRRQRSDEAEHSERQDHSVHNLNNTQYATARHQVRKRREEECKPRSMSVSGVRCSRVYHVSRGAASSQARVR